MSRWQAASLFFHGVVGACLLGITLWLMTTVPLWSGYETARAIALSYCWIIYFLTLPLAWLYRRTAMVRRVRPDLFMTIVSVVLSVLLIITMPTDLPDYQFVLIVLVGYAVAMLSLMVSIAQYTKTSLTNTLIAMATFFIVAFIADGIAPRLTDQIAQAQRQVALEQRETAFQNANHPLSADAINARDRAQVFPAPQADILEQAPGPAWGEFTGWGTMVNARMRYWMDGVYDNIIEYNSLGFRGDAIPYEKPDDVYRIMILGDSFIEAREVAYEDTIYAQLNALLADARTPDGKRIEVMGVGATGWGTIQSYLYYHHEGYKFSPDLVVNVFVINDVVDNYPSQFYPSRTIEFAISEEDIALIDTADINNDAPATVARRLLDALPDFVTNTHTARLFQQAFDPPPQSVTLGGDLTQLHPQTYIFVRYPDIDGYEMAWQRTADAYRIWANDVQANGAELIVLAADISVGRISELSTYYGTQADGWVWDVDLPYDQLREILTPLGVTFTTTRDYFAAQSDTVFDDFFYIEDGHWNPAGHRAAAEYLAQVLREQGIIQP